MTTEHSTLARRPTLRPSARPVLRFLRSKGTSMAMSAMDAWARALHRLAWRLSVRGLDHVTIPCLDLRTAEEFYVGILSARVLMRIDEAFLRKVGRFDDADKGAIHTSIVFSGGPRLDLFIQSEGQPPRHAGHPHYAFHVSPDTLLKWKRRLNDAGVPTWGPTRLGPPGQASLYFNDPSGNHLELVTRGFVAEIPVGAPDMNALVYEWRAR
jgi:catechol 2,3-dioxygenase-like lactoylglutathione lyase family enzyme